MRLRGCSWRGSLPKPQRMGASFASRLVKKLAGPGWNIFARKGFLAEYRAGRQVASIDLRAMPGLPGAHNHQNACAAYAVARSLGAAPRL